MPTKGYQSGPGISSAAGADVIVLDNGAGRIKYGTVTGSNSRGNQISEPSGSVINSLAKINKQMSLLVGDQVEEVHNGSLLHYTRPFERGYLTNMAVEVEVWDRLFAKTMKLPYDGDHKFGDKKLVVTDAPFAPIPLQNDMNELAFEYYGFDQFLRRPAPWFSAYEHEEEVKQGKREANYPNCCTVIDSGFSFTFIMPFIDGKCVKSAVKRVNVGGKLLTNYLKELVSYRQWNMMDEFKLMEQVKEELCYVSQNFAGDLRGARAEKDRKREGKKVMTDYKGEKLKKIFTLPDFSEIMRGYVKADDEEVAPGEQILGLDTERFSVPEVLFHPSDVGMSQAGIAEATWQSLQELGQVEQGLASSNLVLTGGNMCLPEIEARYYQEVRQHIPDIFGVEVYRPENPVTYAWKGAARFVSNHLDQGTLDGHMVSRAEYLERGHDYVNEKFFRGW